MKNKEKFLEETKEQASTERHVVLKAKNKNKEILNDESQKKRGQITSEWCYWSFTCIHNEGEKKCKK